MSLGGGAGQTKHPIFRKAKGIYETVPRRAACIDYRLVLFTLVACLAALALASSPAQAHIEHSKYNVDASEGDPESPINVIFYHEGDLDTVHQLLTSVGWADMGSTCGHAREAFVGDAAHGGADGWNEQETGSGDGRHYGLPISTSSACTWNERYHIRLYPSDTGADHSSQSNNFQDYSVANVHRDDDTGIWNPHETGSHSEGMNALYSSLSDHGWVEWVGWRYVGDDRSSSLENDWPWNGMVDVYRIHTNSWAGDPCIPYWAEFSDLASTDSWDYGNYGWARHLDWECPNDDTPPTTTLSETGDEGSPGWYTSNVDITLACEDDHGGPTSGCHEVEYRVNGGSWSGDTIFGDSGSTSFTLTAQGEHTLEYRSEDNADNWEPIQTETIRIDKYPPSLDISLSGTQLDNGWWEPGVQVTLSCSDSDSGVDEIRYHDGGWQTYTGPYTIHEEGTSFVDAECDDKAGNTDWDFERVDIDDDAPSTSSSYSADQGDDGWYISPIQVTLSCSDSTSGCDRTEYRINGGSWRTYTGTFTISDEGQNVQLEYRSIDEAGHTETSQSDAFDIDHTNPETGITLSGDHGQKGWYHGPVDVSLSCSDSTSGCDGTQYRIDGGTWQTYTASFTIHDEGVTELEYRSEDHAGNHEAATTQDIKIDTEAPQTTHTGTYEEGEDGWIVTPVAVTLDCQDDASGCELTEYRIDGGPWQTYTASFTIEQEGEAILLEYKSTDEAGNPEPVNSETFNIDHTPPNLTVTLDGDQGDDGWHTSNVTLTLSATDSHSGTSILEHRTEDGSWQTYTEPIQITEDGLTNVTVRATDNAGNENEEDTPIKIDRTPPTTSLTYEAQEGNDGWLITPVQTTLTCEDGAAGCDATEYRINEGPWQTYTGPFNIDQQGDTIQLDHRSTDNAGNQEATNTHTFTIDHEPPQTTHTLDGDAHDEEWWKSPITVTLNATDNASGVNRTTATIVNLQDEDEAHPGSGDHAGEPPLSFTLEDGIYNVSYHSTDEAGNQEDPTTLQAKSDTTPPRTTPTIQGDRGTNDWYTTPVTITLQATDNASGTDHTEYRIDDGAWQPYNEPIDLDQNGLHNLTYQSTDNVGHQEDPNTTQIKIDTTPPETTTTLHGDEGDNNWYTTPVNVTFTATDDLSGTNITEYRIDEGAWTTYTEPIPLEDDAHYTIHSRSIDNAGNQETATTTQIKIDTAPPNTTSTIHGDEGDNGWYATPVTITLDATDSASGIDHTEYRINDDAWTTYEDPLTLDHGLHNITYRSIDNAGNQETATTTQIKIDTTPPQTTSILDGDEGNDGWYLTTVNVTLDSTDDLSGVNHTEYRIDPPDRDQDSNDPQYPVYPEGWTPYEGPITLYHDGTYTVEYRSTDQAGNQEQDRTIQTKLDTTPPEATVEPPNEPPLGDAYNVTWEASDETSGLQTVTIYEAAIVANTTPELFLGDPTPTSKMLNLTSHDTNNTTLIPTLTDPATESPLITMDQPETIGPIGIEQIGDRDWTRACTYTLDAPHYTQDDCQRGHDPEDADIYCYRAQARDIAGQTSQSPEACTPTTKAGITLAQGEVTLQEIDHGTNQPVCETTVTIQAAFEITTIQPTGSFSIHASDPLVSTDDASIPSGSGDCRTQSFVAAGNDTACTGALLQPVACTNDDLGGDTLTATLGTQPDPWFTFERNTTSRLITMEGPVHRIG